MGTKKLDSPLVRRFADRLRATRLEQDLSQERLAHLTGLHRTYVGSIERCERNVSLLNIEKLAKALRISAASLLSSDDYK